LIERYGKLAADEAIKRLTDPRWFVKRNMLYIIRVCGTPDAMLYVSSYLHHENLKVRAEAIRAALKWSPKEALRAIREMIRSPSDEEFELGLNFVATQKITELVPELLEVLKTKDLLGDVLTRKMMTIKALCTMKAKEALPAFREIMQTKSFLYRKYYDQMKLEILKAIEEFPYDEIKEILQVASESKNKEIRSLAEKLLKEKGPTKKD
ncbi:MAG: HEAT repeat domain-containing protein, partial [Nitrospirae bacterium]